MKEGGICFLSFTERGRGLAQRLCEALGGEASCTRDGVNLRDWTAEHFPRARALVYVGAAGIAVRAVAPHLVSKASDPAVVAVDERGHFAVPLASGHLGGANELARAIARVTGGTAAITTATDAGGVFAVDEWARVQDCAVVGVERIKTVSAALLAGERVIVRSAFPISSEPPEGVELTGDGEPDVWVDILAHAGLVVAPRALILGVGCRRGTTSETLEERFAAFCKEQNVLGEAICGAATIDLKKNEEGLLAFCEAHGWPLQAFSAEILAEMEGAFSASDFVAATTGVDNVCERAALCAAGCGGELTARKFAGGGVTFALAKKPVRLDWRLQHG
ncbi:MAG: cobalamin biosynthesis protein CbiG [Ruminococcaceae bacterium]|nr:cobalamin biosynthesis protein CbiG [Oscillospiraceae bacterium]